MSRLAAFGLAGLLGLAMASQAFGWGVVSGPRGGAVYRGPAGAAAVRTPSGAAAVRGPYGAAAVRGPAGGVAVRAPYPRPAYVGVVRPWVAAPYYGAVVAGVALGTVIAATAVPPPPSPELCWYWSSPAQNQGYWDYCY